MKRFRLIFLLIFLLPMAGNSAAAQTAAQILHAAILREFDARKYVEAIQLLKRMKAEEPARYAQLPYGLLYAKALVLAKNQREAFPIYENLTSDKRLAPYVLLPLARMAASEGVVNSALHYYQEYLSHAYPDYVSVAREALEYCWGLKKAEPLYSTAQVVQNSSTMDRLAQLYLARAYVLRGDTALGRNLFANLISAKKKDDITSLALSDLDALEGTPVSDQEKKRRGKLAYDVWNFELAKKYLRPIASESMEDGFYYAHSLYFLGDYEKSKEAFQVALGSWPKDPMYSQALYQYANVYLREGDYEKAAEQYKQLRGVATGKLQDTAAFKMIYALRAQQRFPEALRALELFTRSRNLTLRGQALSLRGRIYFQTGKYSEAASDFQAALNLKPYRNQKELLLWKGITLEKLRRSSEARSLLASVASGTDFYSHKARERLSTAITKVEQKNAPSISLPRLPDISEEEEIIREYAAGNVTPAFLYLHLYEEASQLLPDVDRKTWKILSVDENDRLQKYLAITFLAGIGKNYPTATYYSELFVKSIPRGVNVLSFTPEILKILFPLPYKDEVEQYAKKRKLDPLLVLSIMKQESKFKRFARSQSFARGLMQIIPSTATKLAEAIGLENFSQDLLYVPEININLGTRYVEDLIKEFGNTIEFVAAGYNGGEQNVRRWRDASIQNETLDFVSSIDFPETKNYVMIVKTNYELYKRIYGDSLSGSIGSSSQH
jgi:peptidoglycan lytic transglycosylase